MSINSHFIIRLRVDDFEHERKNMKTNDETIDITINAIRTKNFHDEETKKKALESQSAEIRITEIELETKKGKKIHRNTCKHIYHSKNSPHKILKELYNKRWKIETNFDRLKNIIHIENFSGYSEGIIQQGLLRQHIHV